MFDVKLPVPVCRRLARERRTMCSIRDDVDVPYNYDLGNLTSVFCCERMLFPPQVLQGFSTMVYRKIGPDMKQHAVGPLEDGWKGRCHAGTG